MDKSDISIEITAHKKAGKKIIAEAKEATKNVKRLLDENHVTLTLVYAIGKRKNRCTKYK